MAFDSMTLNAIVDELAPELINARIGRIHQPDQHTVILRYSSSQGPGRLLLCTQPQNGRLVRTAASRDNPAKAPMFAMVLRKWLDGARIVGLSCTDGERVAELRLDARNDIGDIIPLRLILEIMGKHSNLILVNGDGIIVDGIRRYGSALSRYREVLPGRPYLPPPPLHKEALPPADENALAALIWRQEGVSVAEVLRREIRGLSPLLADHVLAAAGLPTQATAEELGAAAIHRLYEELAALRRLIGSQGWQPTLRQENGVFTDFAALAPACWPEAQQVAAPSMNDAVDAYYCQREQEAAFRRRQATADKALRHHMQRLSKKISLQEGDLAQCEAADAYKEAGDLLSANLWYLEKGPDQVELPSFADPEVRIAVKLDPAKSPQENVSWYYHRFAKAKKARVQIQSQLDGNREELDYLLSIHQSLQDCESSEEVAAVEKEAAAAGYFRLAEEKRGQKPPAAAQLPPRSAHCQGFTILIGRNNRQNDKLSLRQAEGEDIWLHAQKIPGCHVIIQTQGREVPEAVLAAAAAYAAWFSKGRDSNQVPVDYVAAARLRKPAGAKPGFVTYTGQRTLYVCPQAPAE